MLNRLKKPNQKGFTIIEVMIVLAIAGLILLIVLLAVPALQRNSRNTTIKSDAGTVAGAINTFESDNNGQAPRNITGTGTVNLYYGTGNCSGTNAPTSSIQVNGSTAVSCITAAPATTPPVGTIQVFVGTNCAGTGGTRNFALYYAIETSGGTSQRCVDS